MIRVVSGALWHADGRILMGKRKSLGLRPDLWELPGGKCDGDEWPQNALIREWKEELGVSLKYTEIGPIMASVMLHVEVDLIVELYPVENNGLEPQMLDHQELRWVELEHAVKHLPCSPAFYLHYPYLRDFKYR